MPLDIPVKAIAFNSFSVVLDGEQFILKLIWNDREESWRLDIFDNFETRIISGLKLVPNVLLTTQYKGTNLPKGLLGVEVKKPNDRPTFESLGTSMKLTYFTEEEVSG